MHKPGNDDPIRKPLFSLLADAIDVLRLRSWMHGTIPLKTPWGLQFAGEQGWFHLLSTNCVARISDPSMETPVSAGDLIITLPGIDHQLLERSETPAAAIRQIIGSSRRTETDTQIDGQESSSASLVSGCFLLDDLDRSPLRVSLPPLLHVRGDGQRPLPYIEYILRLTLLEAQSQDPCSHQVINRLVRILLLKAIQDCMLKANTQAGGWLGAIADRDIGQAIALMHDQPESPWTVAGLAERVAMSRSLFSARFSSLVGKPPLEYLFEWRMQKASHLLRTTRDELKEVAVKIGYESPSAFSKAFTRWSGTAPGTYRQTVNRGPDTCSAHLSPTQIADAS